MEVINGKINGFIGEDIIYVGRKNFSYKLEASPLANPYVISKARSLDESLLLYKKWILNMYGIGKGSVYDELIRLSKLHKEGINIKLACWCAPNKCHGDIIVQVIKFIVINKLV